MEDHATLLVGGAGGAGGAAGGRVRVWSVEPARCWELNLQVESQLSMRGAGAEIVVPGSSVTEVGPVAGSMAEATLSLTDLDLEILSGSRCEFRLRFAAAATRDLFVDAVRAIQPAPPLPPLPPPVAAAGGSTLLPGEMSAAQQFIAQRPAPPGGAGFSLDQLAVWCGTIRVEKADTKQGFSKLATGQLHDWLPGGADHLAQNGLYVVAVRTASVAVPQPEHDQLSQVLLAHLNQHLDKPGGRGGFVQLPPSQLPFLRLLAFVRADLRRYVSSVVVATKSLIKTRRCRDQL